MTEELFFIIIIYGCVAFIAIIVSGVIEGMFKFLEKDDESIIFYLLGILGWPISLLVIIFLTSKQIGIKISNRHK